MLSFNRSEYLKLPVPNTKWVWKGLIPVSGSALIHSNPKVGKSFLTLGLAAAIADPKVDTYLGQAVQTHGRVLYVQLDTPRSIWTDTYVKKTSPAADDIFFIDRETESIPLPFDIRLAKCREWLKRAVVEVDPVLTVLDTVRRFHQANENDSTEMSIVLEAFLWSTVPSALLMLAHQRKVGAMGDVGDSVTIVRGSSAITGAVDALIHLSKTKMTIQARSDVDEEIHVYQQDNGFFTLQSKGEEVADLIAELHEHGLKTSEIDAKLMEEYGISQRTARNWRNGYTKPRVLMGPPPK